MIPEIITKTFTRKLSKHINESIFQQVSSVLTEKKNKQLNKPQNPHKSKTDENILGHKCDEVSVC